MLYQLLQDRVSANKTLVESAGIVPISEATYFGKNMDLVKAEKCIANMKEAFTKSGKYNYNVDEKKYRDSSDELEKILAKLFGFKSVYINKSFIGSYLKLLALPAGGKVGAFTFCRTSALIMDEAFVGDIDKLHDGIKFKPNSKVSCVMMLDNMLFVNNEVPEMDFTPAEILAIILHEIGHNFYSNRDRVLGYQAFLTVLCPSYLMSWMMYEFISPLIKQADAFAGDTFLKSPRDFMRSLITKWDSTIVARFLSEKDLTLMNLTPVKFMLKGIYALSQMLSGVGVLNAYVMYDTEKYADSFATAYGYGADLASALVKFDESYMAGKLAKMQFSDKTHIRNLGNLMRDVDHVIMFPVDIMMELCDPHPKTSARLVNNIKYLEECADSIDNPRLRAEYLSDVKRINKMQDDIIKKGKDGGWKDRFTAQDIELMRNRKWTDIKDSASAMTGKNNDITVRR